MNGVVVVDKPSGPTSHDVVMRLRRILGTRRVGHAGTLDPMASGVLIALVGEGTKLGPYATAQDKEYRARVAFGRATSTLDALGETTAETAVPGWLHDELGLAAGGCLPGASRLTEALTAELARTSQAPPAFSAIKVDGRKAYDLARAGRPIELAERSVEVHALDLIAAGGEEGGAFVELRVRAAKGYYVRSLAHDLGEHLGVAAHLASLQRTASGPFTLADAVSLGDPARLRSAVLPLDEGARRCLAAATLTPLGAQRARMGQALDEACFVDPSTGDAPTAWFDSAGRLCAIGQRGGDGFHRVRRGFTDPEATQ
jgi:tRNA pseudouridine55 synthase